MRNIAIVLLVTLFVIAYSYIHTVSTNTPEQTDTFKDMLISIQTKTPNMQVQIDIISKNYAPTGVISHIGDNYVCIRYNETQACAPFDKIQGVEFYP